MMQQEYTGSLNNINIVLPKRYADVNKYKPKEYYDYDNFQIKFGSVEKYEIIKKIGRGKYSDVYLGICTTNDQYVVLKILKPVKKQKIKREISILQNLQGGPNIIKLIEVVQDPASKTQALVFEYVNTDFRAIIPQLTDMEIRYYMFQLLRALEYCHSNGIMHRDIKPSNIIVDREKKYIKVIDWGLAEYYHAKQDYIVRVASRYFKGPELLVDNVYYDYSLDIWSTGVMFAQIIFKKEPLFNGKDNDDQLVKIVQIMGTEDLQNYLEKYNLQLNPKFNHLLINSIPKKTWDKFINQTNKNLCCSEAIDLLDKMLIFDHSERILAKEAMEHPYFDPIRNQ